MGSLWCTFSVAVGRHMSPYLAASRDWTEGLISTIRRLSPVQNRGYSGLVASPGVGPLAA